MPGNGCTKGETVGGGLLDDDLIGTVLTVTACLCSDEDFCNASLQDLVEKADAEAEENGAGSLIGAINALISAFIMAFFL